MKKFFSKVLIENSLLEHLKDLKKEVEKEKILIRSSNKKKILIRRRPL